MKRHRNTLYVSTQGTYLHKEGEAIVVKVDGEQKAKLPIHNIESILCFGNVLCSPYLLGHCAENDVSVSLLTEYGRFIGRVTGPVSGNVLLRREQYRWADDGKQSAKAATFIVTGKIANSRAVLRRFIRDNLDHPCIAELRRTIDALSRQITQLSSPLELETIRGIEGTAANSYFQVFDHLILQQKDQFHFNGRNKRPPKDRVNAMLSYIYVLIMHDVRSALESIGLDPSVGYLHRDRPGRYGLALDLMEEFRSFIGDRLVLSMINRKQIASADFRIIEGESVLLNEDGRKKVITAYQERKQEEIYHPFLEEKCTYGRLYHLQALIFARWIRGDIDGYPPFLWK